MTQSHFAPPGPLGFGGTPLGNMFDVVPEETAEAALLAAWETGVRHFDTAPHYGSGLSLWTKEPERSRLNPSHHIPGPYT
jgi:D-threo-aldose 1-dehydrogenase